MKGIFSPVKNIYTKLFSIEVPLEKRITHAMLLCAMFGTFFGFIESFVLNLPIIAVILPLILFFLLLGFSFWGFYTERMELFALVSISVIAFIVFPLMFFANAGMQGGMIFYFVIAAVCIALVLKGKTRVIIFFAVMAEYTGLFFLYNAAPQYFLPMTHETAFIDQLCSMLISSFILFMFSYSVAQQNLHDRETIEKLSKIYEHQANTDELTGLYNRRYFNNFMKLAISTLGDTGKLHLAMFDLDDFKVVNDKYGHPFGDTVLQQFAEILKKAENDGTTACRYGGEEFLLLISKKDRDEAIRIAEKIIKDVWSQIQIGRDGFVTASAGFTTCREGLSYEALIQEVDERLYDAKCAGKNRIVSE